jgi:NAD(P)-dependent dehydrogenase (short-subunit alcohol dehydrogenase family)
MIMTTTTVLITGTSRPRGLGFAVARQLAERNYHVVLTTRNTAQAEQLATRAMARSGGESPERAIGVWSPVAAVWEVQPVDGQEVAPDR